MTDKTNEEKLKILQERLSAIKQKETTKQEIKAEEDEDKKKSSDCPNCKISQNTIAQRGMTSMGGSCPNCGHKSKIKPEEEVKKDANLHYGGVRHASKEYEQGNESAQITEVKEEDEEEEEDEDKKNKSGYQTEDGNNQLGGQGVPKEKKLKKSSENYINSLNKDSGKDMDKDTSTISKTEEEKSSEDEEKKDEVEREDKNASFQEAIKSNIGTLTDVIKSLAETQKDVSSTLVGIDDRLKALETPTDLPLKPSTSASEDVGAKVTVPDTYQANSVQAGLDDDKHAEDKPKSDPSGLKMQEKSFDFTTETPRPSAAVETINKSAETDMSFVLKDAREGGNLSVVARDILAGKYYTPTPDEVGTY